MLTSREHRETLTYIGTLHFPCNVQIAWIFPNKLQPSQTQTDNHCTDMLTKNWLYNDGSMYGN